MTLAIAFTWSTELSAPIVVGAYLLILACAWCTRRGD